MLDSLYTVFTLACNILILVLNTCLSYKYKCICKFWPISNTNNILVAALCNQFKTASKLDEK